MELDITKVGPKGEKGELDFYRVENYVVIPMKSDLILVKESAMAINDQEKEGTGDLYELFKVQFIALCDTDLAKSIMVAFYLGEGGQLYPYILSGLPNRYYQDIERAFLIDYKSYAEFCELTGETKLALFDYINEVKTGSIGINTFLLYQGQVHNYDGQKKLYNPEPLLNSQDN